MFLPGALTRFVIEDYREEPKVHRARRHFASKPIELDIDLHQPA